MRYFLVMVLMLLLISCQQGQQVTELSSEEQKTAYSLGADFGRNVRETGMEIDRAALIQGLNDALDEKEMLLDEQEVRQTLIAFSQQVRKKQTEMRAASAGENKEEGAAFLAENKKKSGVVTLPSGLQYEVIKEGSGKSPDANSKVKVHYRGTLLDGKEFDSSYKRGEPAEFGVSEVIKGWTEALQLMKEGAKWKLYIPSDLAYGERGSGRSIPPNATLIFEVELLEVK